MKNIRLRVRLRNKHFAKRYKIQWFGIISLFVYKASLFYEALFRKGIVTLGDLTTNENGVCTGLHIMTRSSPSPKDKFQLMAIIDALPAQWRRHLKNCNDFEKKLTLSNSAQLHLNGHSVSLDKIVSKNIYKEIRSKFEIIPTAQLRYTEIYNDSLEWYQIYRIPFKVAIDTKSREFQYKVLHRYLATNMFLHKIGLAPSPLCTFCERESESIEHLLIKYDYSNKFWQDFINWFNRIGIEVKTLSEVDKIFGIWNRQTDFHLLNHLLILAKQHIYFCRNKGFPPSPKIYLAKVASIYQI